jgi:hypothetical protein
VLLGVLGRSKVLVFRQSSLCLTTPIDTFTGYQVVPISNSKLQGFFRLCVLLWTKGTSTGITTVTERCYHVFMLFGPGLADQKHIKT